MYRKISEIGTTRCHILRLKCTEFAVRWGPAPDPAGEAHSAPPDSLAVFNGPTCKWKGKIRVGEREGKER